MGQYITIFIISFVAFLPIMRFSEAANGVTVDFSSNVEASIWVIDAYALKVDSTIEDGHAVLHTRNSRFPVAPQITRYSSVYKIALRRYWSVLSDAEIAEYWSVRKAAIDSFDARKVWYVSDSGGMQYCVGYDTKDRAVVAAWKQHMLTDGINTCNFALVPESMRGGTYVWYGGSIFTTYGYQKQSRPTTGPLQ